MENRSISQTIAVTCAALALSACGGGSGGGGASNDGDAGPVADAGPDLSINRGEVAHLDGVLSRGDALSYEWSLVSRPEGTLAYLDGATTRTPTLAGLGVGEYDLELIVSDGTARSAPDAVAVIVNTLSGTAPPRDAVPGEINALYELGLISIKQQLRNAETYQLDSDLQFRRYSAIGRPAEGSVSLYFYASNDFGVPIRSQAICPVEWSDPGHWRNTVSEDLKFCFLYRE